MFATTTETRLRKVTEKECKDRKNATGTRKQNHQRPLKRWRPQYDALFTTRARATVLPSVTQRTHRGREMVTCSDKMADASQADVVVENSTALVDDSEREKLLENAIDAADKILKLRDSLNELLENGLLELARMRYSNGNKSVSALQLNMGEVEALRTVRCHFDDPKHRRYPHFELLDAAVGSGNPENNAAASEVRKRGEAAKPSEEPHERPASPTDPLRWFGLLVPQSLRRSQKCFVNALELIVDVANEQSRLTAALDAYKGGEQQQGVPVRAPEP